MVDALRTESLKSPLPEGSGAEEVEAITEGMAAVAVEEEKVLTLTVWQQISS